MRWQPEAAEDEADRRGQWRLRFALFPRRMRDGVWVWLEDYWMREVPIPARVYCETGIRFESERRAVGSPEQWRPQPACPTGSPPSKP